MATESKDQRRSRLNREGKEFLKTGQEHLITDSHRTAMDYFKRKDSRKNARRKAEVEFGDTTGSGTKARGENPQAPTRAGKKPLEFAKWEDGFDKRLDKQQEVQAEIREDVRGEQEKLVSAGKLVLPDEPRNPINREEVHHGVMTKMGHFLGDVLDDAEQRGQLHSKNTVDIDNRLAEGYKSLAYSQDYHKHGEVNKARHYMQSAADHFYAAGVSMRAKGLSNITDKHLDLIKGTAEQYISSKTPGVGSMPHLGFKAPKEVDTSDPTTGKHAKKVSGAPLAGGSDDASWIGGSSYEPTERQESHSLMSRQIRDALGY